MFKKNENGFSGIDIIVSLIILTISITFIGSLVTNINLNSKYIERQEVATSYAVKEIEKIKAEKYKNTYDLKGITNEEVLKEEDINDSTGNFTGYHEKVKIKDYVLLKNDNSKKSDVVKKITVEITYKFLNNEEKVELSTFVAKE